MDRRLVQPERRLLRARAAEAGAERDVRGRVLVEERVEVRHAALADARRRVDECDLAEAASVLLRIAVDVARDEVAVLVVRRGEPDEPAAAKLAAQPVDQPPLERERERARERALG